MKTVSAPADQPFSGAASGNTGLIPVANNASIENAKRKEAEDSNSQPVIRGLAGHVDKCFNAAKTAKQHEEQRMLRSLRARRGEYDPEVLAQIRETGTSEVFMMLSAEKARSCTAVMRDIFLGNGNEKPWTASPTKLPEIPQDMLDQSVTRAGELVQQIQDLMGGPQNVPESQVEDLLWLSRARAEVEVMLAAKKGMTRMEAKMEDQLQEGGFAKAFAEFLDDLSTFPSAILKGPVIRNKPQMTWSEPDADGMYTPVVANVLTAEWDRVSPLDIYPAPGASDIDDGYLIELHRLYPYQLEELIGVEGYNEGAIRAVIDAYGVGGLREYTNIDSERAEAEGKSSSDISDTTSPTIGAVQYWGPVLGKELIDFGMDKKLIAEPTKTYHCEVWVIGSWVIKATLNYDFRGRKPYFKGSYESLPGAFWGNSPVDLIRDCQIVCNNAARALTNNMAIASGPQVVENVDRMAPGQSVSNMYPWKVYQTTSDPYGSTALPVTFFQPGSNAMELMAVYDKFALLADSASGIPRYVTGEGPAAGAGRTASGLSMMLASSSKILKSSAMGIDLNVIGPAIERLFYHNMRYGTDSELKNTDVKIVARGAASLIVKESAQVRRNEFLNIVLSNPNVIAIIGEEAIAELLRTMASGLDLDTDKLIPPPEVIKARLFQQRQQQAQADAFAKKQMEAEAGEPSETLSFQHDDTGRMTGMTATPGKGAKLMNGAPVTNNFGPAQ
jgi:hypothetical protein